VIPFGGLEAVRVIVVDARQALRFFRRRPTFTIACVLTLAVGSGVVASVYTAARWLTGIGRTPRPPARLTAVVTRDLLSEAPELPMFGVRTARQAVDLQFADRHAMARVAMTLSAIGLVLAAIGLYGVVSSIVAARRHEIGIRAALGATPRRIVGMLAWAGLTAVACGALAGLVTAAGASKLLSSYLYDLGDSTSLRTPCLWPRSSRHA